MWKAHNPQGKQIIGGTIMGVKKFTSEVIREGKRVRWPKRDELIPAIIVVVVIAVFAALILYLEDLAGNKIIDILKDAFSGMKSSTEAVSE